MSNGTGYDAPDLVRFDTLAFTASMRPYLEDRPAKPLLYRIAARRLP